MWIWLSNWILFRSNCETFCNMILFEIPTSTQTSQTVGCLRCKLNFPWTWPFVSPIQLIHVHLLQAFLVVLASWDVVVQKRHLLQIRWLRDWNQRSKKMKFTNTINNKCDFEDQKQAHLDIPKKWYFTRQAISWSSLKYCEEKTISI